MQDQVCIVCSCAHVEFYPWKNQRWLLSELYDGRMSPGAPREDPVETTGSQKYLICWKRSGMITAVWRRLVLMLVRDSSCLAFENLSLWNGSVGLSCARVCVLCMEVCMYVYMCVCV